MITSSIHQNIIEKAEAYLSKSYQIKHNPNSETFRREMWKLRYQFFCEYKKWVPINPENEENDSLDFSGGVHHFTIVHSKSNRILAYIRTILGEKLEDFLLGTPFFLNCLGNQRIYFEKNLQSNQIDSRKVMEVSRLCTSDSVSKYERILLSSVLSYLVILQARHLKLQNLWIQTTPKVAQLYQSYGGKFHYKYYHKEVNIVFADLDIWSTPESFNFSVALGLKALGNWYGKKRDLS